MVVFRDGHRFSGKQRLIHSEIRRAADYCVRGNAVALGKYEEIADDDLAPGDPSLLTVANHECPRTRQIAQRLQRAFALTFLSERDADDHEHEREQHRSLALVTQHQIYRATGDQQQEHGLARNVSGDREQAAGFRRREFVVSVTRQTGRRIGSGEPGIGKKRGRDSLGGDAHRVGFHSSIIEASCERRLFGKRPAGLSRSRRVDLGQAGWFSDCLPLLMASLAVIADQAKARWQRSFAVLPCCFA